MKNMKLLYVSEVYLPGRKASGIHVMRMCKAFSEQGLKVRLLAFRSKQYSDVEHLFDYYGIDDSFEIKFLRSPGTGRLAAFYMALRAMFEVLFFRPHIAYTRSPVSSLFFSLLNRPFAFEGHVILDQSAHKWLSSFFQHFSTVNNFLGLVVISSALKKMFVEKGTPPEDIFVAHDAADAKSLDEKGELKGNFGFNAGYFGNIYKGRGVEIIVAMAKKRPEIGFHIIGGIAEDLPGNPELPDNLVFYGFLPPSEVHLYRNACDVLLAPYQSEVFVSNKQAFSTSLYMSPLKIFEYMSARKAIIVSDMPVLREVLSDTSSMLVAPADENAWVDAIDILKRDETKREEIARNAYQKFCEEFTWGKRAESILQWLLDRLKN